MITKVFTVRDQKAAAYLLPFFQMTTGMAIRSFSDRCNDLTHGFCQHPEDYTLWQLGTFEDESGLFDLLPVPLLVRQGIQCKTQAELTDAPLLHEVPSA